MLTFKNILSVAAAVVGVACMTTPNEAQAQTSISIGIGGPIVRPVPAPIIRPVPAPIGYPVPAPIGYPVLRPSYPPLYPPVVPIVRDRHDFEVLYRDCAHDPWRVYARFDERDDAERAAFRLRRSGNEVFIQTIHRHR
jgi:hypothetical protein